MRFFQVFLPLASLLTSVRGNPTPAHVNTRDGAVDHSYIVVLRADILPNDAESHIKWADSVHKRGVNSFEGIRRRFDFDTFHGYAGEFDDATIDQIRKSPDVIAVEANTLVELVDWSVQEDAEPALVALSSRGPEEVDYEFPSTAGQDTFAYIVDSGIRLSHVEFEGRASLGFDAFGGPGGDTFGHGTHVAGTVGGKTFGGAKKTHLIDVKVFEGRTTSLEVLLSGMDWAVNDIVSKDRLNKSIINMSLGGLFAVALKHAVDAAERAGILCITAAGNNGLDTHNFFLPCAANSTLCVGAVDKNWKMASFSNWGYSVDVLAVGVNVTSAWMENDTQLRNVSGTSMATPAVAGMALTLLASEKFSSPQQLKNRIIQMSTKEAIVDIRPGTPNRMAYNGRDLTCRADNCLRALRASHISGRLEESQEFCGEYVANYITTVDVLPGYLSQACGASALARASSACLCLPVPTAA